MKFQRITRPITALAIALALVLILILGMGQNIAHAEEASVVSEAYVEYFQNSDPDDEVCVGCTEVVLGWSLYTTPGQSFPMSFTAQIPFFLQSQGLQFLTHEADSCVEVSSTTNQGSDWVIQGNLTCNPQWGGIRVRYQPVEYFQTTRTWIFNDNSVTLQIEVNSGVQIPPVPVGISITNPPLERGNWEKISFFSGTGADSLYFSSSLPISDIPQGCTPNQVPVFSLSCDPGDYSFDLFIQRDEVATTVTFFARSWYGAEERHTSITAGIADPPTPAPDTTDFAVEGGPWVREGSQITLTSAITVGQYYDRVPLTTTLGSGLELKNYQITTPNGGGCSVSPDSQEVICGSVQIEAGMAATLEVYAEVQSSGGLTATLAAGSESETFEFKYSGIGVDLSGDLYLGETVTVTLEFPSSVGWYNLGLDGLVALEAPQGCLPAPRPVAPTGQQWLCEINTFDREISFNAEILAPRGSISIESPYGDSTRPFETWPTPVFKVFIPIASKQ